ncbi:sialidase family protein [Lacipirellula sp.]|uniref:sialidase family protein n=1 Tax=Lacipirellula sp. TaxID=2691419 RepID=UPI003D10CFD9
MLALRSTSLLLLVLLSLGVAQNLRAADLAAQPGLVSSEFIYEFAPFPSCHASTLVETGDGLLGAWFGGTYERHPDVAIYTSRFKDGKWSAPVEVANGVESAEVRYPTWNPVLFQPKSGPLCLYYKAGPSPSTWWGMRMTSTDDGRTWSKPERLPDGIFGPIKNKPVQLASGDLLAPTSSEHDGWRVHFERSTDGGQTWTASDAVNDGKEFAAIQPSVLFHPKGRLQAVGRTKEDGVFTIWSDDDGKTWSPMEATGLPNPNSGTDAVTLADGRQLLVYNHNSVHGDAGRTPLNVALSDDGVHWSAALVLEDDPTRHFSYPAVIQTADGKVHISYTWNRERIKHVVVDPGKLAVAPIVNGEWPK